MSETSTPAETVTGPQTEGDNPTADDADKGETAEDYRAKFEAAREHSRLWEKRARANESAAEKLAEIEDAAKTAEQRAADAQAAAEHRAAEAEARAIRREVALEHSLTRDDAALLDTVTDEEAMRALAKRLATPTPPRGAIAPLEGITPRNTPGADAGHDFVRDLVARAG